MCIRYTIAVDEQRCATVSSVAAMVRRPWPRPPYATGMVSPSSPRWPSADIDWWGNAAPRSTCSACGLISASATAAAPATTCCCSAFNRYMPGPPATTCESTRATNTFTWMRAILGCPCSPTTSRYVRADGVLDCGDARGGLVELYGPAD